jgi:hypothetical protein
LTWLLAVTVSPGDVLLRELNVVED